MEVVEKILNALSCENISPCVVVPCKNFVPLLEGFQGELERTLIYPSREEEGLGICAGAYLAGCFPALIIQNSGLGNLVNAYCSLNQFFGIPILFLVSQRGDEEEKIEAQKPMGAITVRLLNLLGIKNFTFEEPGQADEIGRHLKEYRAGGESIAILLSSKFWR